MGKHLKMENVELVYTFLRSTKEEAIYTCNFCCDCWCDLLLM
jgi:hypothetical protein